MSVFEYLGVFISVIFGLGVTHILAGLSKMIHDRETIHVYWVHVVWSINVLVLMLAVWWGMFWWSTLEQWSFFQFLYIVFYAITLFLLSGILYPWDQPKNYDFKTHFIRNRGWFFGIQFVGWLIDIPETTMKAGEGLRGLPPVYVGFVSALLLLCATGAITKNLKLHAALCILWSVIVVSYLGFTTLSQIAV